MESDMGFFSKVFGPAQALAGDFSFADGRIVTAKEMGYLSANQLASPPAAELLGMLFNAPELGAPFPFASAVNAAPLVAHLYLIALHTGIYLAYTQEILKVDEVTQVDIAKGISDAVDNMRRPGEVPLPDDIKKSVIGAGQGFCKAVVADMNAAAARDPRALQPLLSSNVSRLLLGFIEQAYTHPRPDSSELLLGIGAVHLARLNLLNEVPVLTLTYIQNDLKVRFLKR
jgi:hypothetical protein